MPRKVIQLCPNPLIALCDDGTMWKVSGKEPYWDEVLNVPQLPRCKGIYMAWDKYEDKATDEQCKLDEGHKGDHE